MPEYEKRAAGPAIIVLARQATAQLPHYLRSLRLVLAAAPRLTVAWVTLLVLQGLLPVATVYLTKYVVDGVAGLVGQGYSPEIFRLLALPAALLAGVMLLSAAAESALNWVRTAQAESVQDHVTALIHEKSMTVDLAFYESPEYFDHLHRARSDGSSRSLALLESTGSLLQNSLTLVAMGAVLLPYSIWLPLILVIGTVPAVYTVFVSNHHFHEWWRRTTADRRWAQYYDLLLTDGASAAELRLFQLGDSFLAKYQALRRRLRAERLSLLISQSVARLAASIFVLVISAGALAWMVWRIALGAYTLGDLALFYQAYQRGQGLMQSLLSNLGQIYANSLFLSDLFAFLDQKSEVIDPPRPAVPPASLGAGIVLRDVSFRYPGHEQMVVENVNLTFRAGEITALVGENGAGKSTLVKLLCRFYDPTAGTIEWDGIDARKFSAAALRRRIAVLFQLPVAYCATAGENIALGDQASKPGREQVQEAARSAGAEAIISRLPQGYDSLLGKLFAGGTELSVGEWQRIALARAFLRQAPIILLDEPTSFMDPWAEADWMERFHRLARGRTVIIITHRFTTARHADVIHVMQRGQVVESGSHADLLVREGLYARSWHTQVASNHSDDLARVSSAAIPVAP